LLPPATNPAFSLPFSEGNIPNTEAGIAAHADHVLVPPLKNKAQVVVPGVLPPTFIAALAVPQAEAFLKETGALALVVHVLGVA
jgi:hypothetical protein